MIIQWYFYKSKKNGEGKYKEKSAVLYTKVHASDKVGISYWHEPSDALHCEDERNKKCNPHSDSLIRAISLLSDISSKLSSYCTYSIHLYPSLFRHITDFLVFQT